MDVETPLHDKDIIPVAKLVCIEVMGQIVDESQSEGNNVVIVVHNYCFKFINKACSCCCACLVFMVCFGGIFVFITGFPFSYY